MSDSTLPNDEAELERLYNETVEQHNVYLDKIHAAFDKRCDEISKQTKEKLDKVDESDQETKNQILKEEQDLLQKTLGELKYAINKSTSNARKKLEEIQDIIENKQANIDAEMANL